MGKKALLFYITLFLLILAFSTTATHFDYDLWARLIAGMGVIDGGNVLTSDFLSYTPVHTWFDHEWGSGAIFYAVLKLFGAYSLIILQALMLFGIFFVASRVVKNRTNISPYNILFYFFTLMAVMENLNNPIRCHMFSFLFFTIFIYLLEKVRKGNNKLLFIIPTLIILWNNIHGGVVAGLGLLGMYAVGEFLNKKPCSKYLITLAISLPLLLINPWGYKYTKFLLMANTMKRPYIVEWWGLFSKFYLFKLPHWKNRMIYIMLLFISIFTLSSKNFSVPVGMDAYPVKEVEFIKANNIKGNILTNFGYGSYVSYKLYPQNKIFMDGRYEEVYYDYMVPMLKEFLLAYPHWKQVFEYFPPDVMIIENSYPVYNVLKQEGKWIAVYEGKYFGVFLPKKVANKKFVQPTSDINYYKNTLFTTGIKF